MLKMIKKLFDKYKELILYVVFGVLTTAVNFVSFWLLGNLLGDNLYLINNCAAWIISVIFAYITNKLFVFESKSWNIKVVAKESLEFLVARIFSFGVEEGGLWLFVEILKFDKYSFEIFDFVIDGKLTAKIVLAVIVVILNYFFSKFIIFAKKNKQ